MLTLDRIRDFYEGRAHRRIQEAERYYHRLIRRYYQFLVPPNRKVIELGCGVGDLVGALQPSRGVGVDFSQSVIDLARRRHPELEFHASEAGAFSPDESFDYLIMSDLVNDLPDVQALLTHLHQAAHGRSRLVLNFFNHLWHPVLKTAERFGLKAPTLLQNWLSHPDMLNLLDLAGWEWIKTEKRILWPVGTPLLSGLLNRGLAPFLSPLCLTLFMVARPKPRQTDRHYACSVVIPARNEAGNIEAAVQRMPEMGKGTEIIFVEGGSKDETWEAIQTVKTRHPERTIKAIRQTSLGKGNAVREGFALAGGELFFILDADLTVSPEQLPKFYEVAQQRTAELVNGVRLVYPMEKQAMRLLNMVGNKCFSLVFSWLLGQRIKDTLCGTKVFFRDDYEAISANRAYFGEFDPFGDFDLLFGAAKLNLKIVDLPIRYQARTYGETNIQRWRHAWLLLKMVAVGARRLKFI